MLKPLFLTLALLSAAATAAPVSAADPAPAAAPTWSVQRFPELGFSAEFPGFARKFMMPIQLGKDEKGAEQGEIDLAMVFNGSPDHGLMVMRMDMSKAAFALTGGEAEMMNRGLDMAKGGPLLATKPVTISGRDAREITMTKDGKVMRGRIILVGKVMYMAMAVAPGSDPAVLATADNDRFLSSFALIS